MTGWRLTSAAEGLEGVAFDVPGQRIVPTPGLAAMELVAAGDVIRIPRNTPHRVFNDGDAEAVVLVFTTPAGRTTELPRRLEGASTSDEVLAALDPCGMNLLVGEADE